MDSNMELMCVFVCVCRRNCCHVVYHLFTRSLRGPLEVHGVATQTVNNSGSLFSCTDAHLNSIVCVSPQKEEEEEAGERPPAGVCVRKGLGGSTRFLDC